MASKPLENLPVNQTEVNIPCVKWENKGKVRNLFDVEVLKTNYRMVDVEPLTSSSGNSDVWKISYTTEAEGSRTELKKFKALLQETIGKFRCYDIFHNDRNQINVFVYPTKRDQLTRRQYRNKKRAETHAAKACAPGRETGKNVAPNKAVNFVKGETLLLNSTERKGHLDAMEPIMTRLTHMSLKSEEKRYALSRFRDEHVFKLARCYLAYNQGTREAVDSAGNTFLTATVSLKAMGLPTGKELEELYYRFCIELMNLDRDTVERDLETCRRHEQNSRLMRLQTLREKEQHYRR